MTGLADVVVSVVKEDQDDDGHWLIELHSGAYLASQSDEAWATYGSPDEQTHKVALHYVAGLLARIVLLAEVELAAEGAVHGCPKAKVYAHTFGAGDSRLLRRGEDHASENEFVMVTRDDCCAVYDPEGWVSFVIPKGRWKIWLRRIEAWLAVVQP